MAADVFARPRSDRESGMKIETSSDDLQVEDVSYCQHQSGALLARIYQPRSKAPRAALVSVHGGRWTRETRLTNAPIDQALARDGNVVMAIDFRMPPIARYPDCVADINLAVRWLKRHAAELGLPAGSVGGIGTSSGGHQLMLCAMRPKDPRYAGLPPPGGSELDATLAFAIMGWPVLDPLARYEMAKAKGMSEHIAAHDAYWPTVEAMAEGNPQLILDRGEPAVLPPVLLIQGMADAILPPDMAGNFAAAYRKAGGTLDLRMFEGEPHTFITKDPISAASVAAIELIAAFVRYRSALSDPPGRSDTA
jgi:acetyl esterase